MDRIGGSCYSLSVRIHATYDLKKILICEYYDFVINVIVVKREMV